MHTLCYISHATFEMPMQMQHLSDILTEARQFNARHDIHGVLYFADGKFLQCLEGQAEDLEQVMQRICRDPRHQDLHIILQQPLSQPLFCSWSMKFISRHHPIKEFFQRHNHSQFCPDQLSPEQLQALLNLMYQLDANDLVA
ncbi:BLUF domain-containing protein [uncultured Acinetobacter sp.]|uniref:BLUF domain-containing protein n=1 Tax=uncultured Acinetobacter sp. TaxID=165433 RepID=UPI00260D2375|nr:BLUF domain-containing protein [uncultured Acinetobacter sp.]